MPTASMGLGTNFRKSSALTHMPPNVLLCSWRNFVLRIACWCWPVRPSLKLGDLFSPRGWTAGSKGIVDKPDTASYKAHDEYTNRPESQQGGNTPLEEYEKSGQHPQGPRTEQHRNAQDPERRGAFGNPSVKLQSLHEFLHGPPRLQVLADLLVSRSHSSDFSDARIGIVFPVWPRNVEPCGAALLAASRLTAGLGVTIYSPAISMTLQTVLKLRSVIGTPKSFSELAASLDLPTPSGACR